MIETLFSSAVPGFCAAIINQANRDYASAIAYGDEGPQCNKAECERFYRGPLFAAMTGNIDPEEYMTLIRSGQIRVSLRKPHVRKTKKEERA